MIWAWSDLIAPWGLGLIGAGLCAWALIKAPTNAARAVCGLVGILFVGSIPSWYVFRGERLAPDYVTRHGLQVVQGRLNRCERAWVEKHTEWVLQFWEQHFDPVEIEGRLLVCVDTKELSLWGRLVRGYSHGRFAVVGWSGAIQDSESLLKHELSHQVVMAFVPYSETVHHELFKQKGLGH